MQHHDKIEKYLGGEFSPEELAAFEKELAANSSLADELAIYRKNELVTKAAVRKQLRAAAAQTYKVHISIHRLNVVRRRRIAIAAGFLIVVVAGLWWFRGSTSPEQLFAQHFEMPVPPSLRDGNAAADTKWQQAVDAYKNREFPTAIALFRELLTDASFGQKESTRLLLGASLIATGANEEAMDVLHAISPGSSYKEDAMWFHALALLNAGRLEEAKSAFEEIATQQRHYKKKEATEILERW